MADLLCLDLVDKDLVCESATLHLSYENRLMREPSHGTVSFDVATSSATMILPKVEDLYMRIANRAGGIKKVSLTFNRVVPEGYGQYNLFVDPEETEREKKMQKAMQLGILLRDQILWRLQTQIVQQMVIGYLKTLMTQALMLSSQEIVRLA